MELEYFYFKGSDATEILDKGGYLILLPLMWQPSFGEKPFLTLEAMGIHVEYSHHEVARSQHESIFDIPMP